MNKSDAENVLERPDAIKPGSSSDDSQALSRSLFDNPREFLEVLRDHFTDLKQPGAYSLSRQDVSYAAEHAKDPKVKAAAEVASKHFDDLKDFDVVAPADRGAPESGISKTAIDRALKYLSGNYKPTLYWEETKNAGITAFSAAGTALMGTFSALTLEAPPVAMLFGSGALALGGMTGIFAYETYMYPSWMRARAEATRTKLQSWPEINRKL